MDAPWELAEAFDRLKIGMNLFATAAEAEAELDASGATVLEDAIELTLDSLSENDFCFAVPFLLHAWFALMPPGYRAPQIKFADLETAFAPELRELRVSTYDATQKMEAFSRAVRNPV